MKITQTALTLAFSHVATATIEFLDPVYNIPKTDGNRGTARYVSTTPFAALPIIVDSQKFQKTSARRITLDWS